MSENLSLEEALRILRTETVTHGNDQVRVIDVLYMLSRGISAKSEKEQDLQSKINNILNLLSSDDVSLDEFQEIVNFIKANKSKLDNLSVPNISGLAEALAEKVNANAEGLSSEHITKWKEKLGVGELPSNIATIDEGNKQGNTYTKEKVDELVNHGLKGDKGEPGERGEKGERGEQGERGLQGINPVIVSETKPEETEASIWIKPNSQIIDLNSTIRNIIEEKLHDMPTGGGSAREIVGEGFPEGKVVAPIGTIYVDTQVTNGALRWIKKSGNGNTGWVILSGDTGLKEVTSATFKPGAKMYLRRINNVVTISFGGLQYDLFGLNAKLSLKGRVVSKPGNINWIRMSTDNIDTNYSIPLGFQTSKSFYTTLYGDAGNIVGTIYIGGKNDLNVIRLQPIGDYPVNGYADLRVGAIIYTTDDPYPTA